MTPLGFIAFGGFVFWLATSFGTPEKPTQITMPKPSPKLPTKKPTAMPAPFPHQVPVIDGKIALVNGARYRAKIQVTGLAKMMASPDLIQSKLEGVGFSGVTVNQTGETDYQATGIWPRPDTTETLPKAVVSLVRVS